MSERGLRAIFTGGVLDLGGVECEDIGHAYYPPAPQRWLRIRGRILRALPAELIRGRVVLRWHEDEMLTERAAGEVRSTHSVQFSDNCAAVQFDALVDDHPLRPGALTAVYYPVGEPWDAWPLIVRYWRRVSVLGAVHARTPRDVTDVLTGAPCAPWVVE